MTPYYYDLHLHSCLSPCGDADMTPNNIAGMGVLNGLRIMALTDHNTAKNCPAFFEAAEKNGIVPVAGMELTTAEDIHVVCLFETLEGALEFDLYVESHRSKYPNRTDIFGEQLILNAMDEPVGSVDYYLTAATEIGADEICARAAPYGGFCYPAHVDRESNGIIAVLGDFPPDADFTAAEFHDGEKKDEYLRSYPALRGLRTIVSSDAHYLWHIKEKKEYFLLDDDLRNDSEIRASLFRQLRSPL